MKLTKTGCKGRNRNVTIIDDGGRLSTSEEEGVEFHARNVLQMHKDGLSLEEIRAKIDTVTGRKVSMQVLVKILSRWDKDGSITTFTRGGKIRMRWSG